MGRGGGLNRSNSNSHFLRLPPITISMPNYKRQDSGSVFDNASSISGSNTTSPRLTPSGGAFQYQGDDAAFYPQSADGETTPLSPGKKATVVNYSSQRSVDDSSSRVSRYILPMLNVPGGNPSRGGESERSVIGSRQSTMTRQRMTMTPAARSEALSSSFLSGSTGSGTNSSTSKLFQEIIKKRKQRKTQVRLFTENRSDASDVHSHESKGNRMTRASYLSKDFLDSFQTRRKTTRYRPRKFAYIKAISPLEKFCHAIRMIRLMIRCLKVYHKAHVVSHVSQMSFVNMVDDLKAARTFRHGLTFDPTDYRANVESSLNEKARMILTTLPEQRTEEDRNYALKRLRAAVDEFAEFPLAMQQALAKVAWLDEFEPKRVIIRQGHTAENFYFMVSGTALVTKNRISSTTGNGYVETVSILNRGSSFGELAIVQHERRAANVVTHTRVTVLTVSRKDYVKIFMHRMDGKEPEFISYLRKLPEFKLYPIEKIPTNKPKICAFTYFRVGVVICENSNESDFIVVIKSGFCRVMKRIKCVKADLNKFRPLKADINSDGRIRSKKRTLSGSMDHENAIKRSYTEWERKKDILLPTLEQQQVVNFRSAEQHQRKSNSTEINQETICVEYGECHDDEVLDKENDHCNAKSDEVDEDEEKGESYEHVYLHVQSLGPKNVFGLHPILFSQREGATPVSLVSEGAECIIINKRYFKKHFDAEQRERLIRTVQPYPTEESLEKDMQIQANWDAYKFITVHTDPNLIKSNKKLNNLKF